jgi:acyl-CoA thioesterase-1
MRNFLLYSAFLSLMLFFSCKENSKQNTENKSGEKEQTEERKDKKEEEKVILFFGNSLTAGMGLEPSEAFPALIKERIDSLGFEYEVINAGLSGETTASGKNRIDWVLSKEVAVFVLELGANDGLRGVPLAETRKNLQEIIDIVNEKNPNAEIILAGMQIPPNMGEAYTTEFRNIFPELAKKNKLKLIPFLLDGVAGDPKLNQQDGIHPTAKGYKIVADNVWDVLKEVLDKKSAS